MRLKLNMIVRPGIVIKSLMNIRTNKKRANRLFFYWCHGERKLLEEGENLCADGTRRKNQQIPHGIAILSFP